MAGAEDLKDRKSRRESWKVILEAAKAKAKERGKKSAKNDTPLD